MEIHRDIWKYMKINHFHEFEFILYVLTCILNAWTCLSLLFCVFLVSGPIQKDARRTNIKFGGTQTSRSFTRTRLVTKTMDGLNPPNVNAINSNWSFGSASPVFWGCPGLLDTLAYQPQPLPKCRPHMLQFVTCCQWPYAGNTTHTQTVTFYVGQTGYQISWNTNITQEA